MCSLLLRFAAAAAFAIYLRVLCAENLPAGHQSLFTARTYTLRPVSQPGSQPSRQAVNRLLDKWKARTELNWAQATRGRKGVSGCSVSCRLPRSLGCLSTLWAEECNSIEQQYRIELKKACHNSELAICDLHKNKLYVQQINYMCCVCIIWNTHELYGILLPFRSI